MPRVVLASIRLRYACRSSSSGTCTVMLPKPKSPSWNVVRSRLGSSVSVMTTCCAGAFAVGLFSKPIRYGIVESPAMKAFGPNPAGPEMKFGSTASVCSVSEWPAFAQGDVPVDKAATLSWLVLPQICGAAGCTIDIPPQGASHSPKEFSRVPSVQSGSYGPGSELPSVKVFNRKNSGLWPPTPAFIAGLRKEGSRSTPNCPKSKQPCTEKPEGTLVAVCGDAVIFNPPPTPTPTPSCSYQLPSSLITTPIWPAKPKPRPILMFTESN